MSVRNDFLKRGFRSAVGTAALMAICCLMTGCMASPFDGEHIGVTNSSFDANGFITEPGAAVTVQYFNVQTNQWQVLAVARSGGLRLEWSGEDWYLWQANDLKIPASGWFPTPDGRFGARIRTVWDGNALATFNQPFDNVFGLEKSIEQLWVEGVKKDGAEVIIKAAP